MTEQRETKTLKTPKGGHDVVLHTYVTVGEKLAIMKAKEETLMETMMRSIIASPSFEEIQNWHGADLDYLLTEMNKVASESTWSAEKKD